MHVTTAKQCTLNTMPNPFKIGQWIRNKATGRIIGKVIACSKFAYSTYNWAALDTGDQIYGPEVDMLWEIVVLSTPYFIGQRLFSHEPKKPSKFVGVINKITSSTLGAPYGLAHTTDHQFFMYSEFKDGLVTVGRGNKLTLK